MPTGTPLDPGPASASSRFGGAAFIAAGIALGALAAAASITLTFNKEDGRPWNATLFALPTLVPALALLRTRRPSRRGVAIGLAAC
jgi:hypothetical protein